MTTVAQVGVVLALLAAGWPLAAALANDASRLERLALAIWLGYATVTLALLLVGLAISYGRLAAVVAWVAALAVGAAVRHRLGPAGHVAHARGPAVILFTPRSDRVLTALANAGTAVVGFQLLALGARGLPAAYDFYGVWGFDAKVFATRGAPTFDQPFNHAYYPAAAPFHHLFLDLWLGRVSTGAHLVPAAVEAIALVFVTRHLARRLGAPPALVALLGFFLCAGTSEFVFSALSGYGDLPLTAGLTIALGAGALWVRSAAPRDLDLSALGGGLAVWSKYEGLPSLAILGAGLLAAGFAAHRPRLVRSLARWLAIVAAVGLPWYVNVAREGLGVGEEHVHGLYLHPGFIVEQVASQVFEPALFGYWWPVAIALAVVTAPRWLRRGTPARFLGIVTAVELGAVPAAYVVSEHAGSVQDIRATAPRLFFHWMPSLVLVLACGIALAVGRSADAR